MRSDWWSPGRYCWGDPQGSIRYRIGTRGSISGSGMPCDHEFAVAVL